MRSLQDFYNSPAWAHCSTWPTEREAIEAAANIMLVDTLTDGHEPGEYLGAFPIPVSP